MKRHPIPRHKGDAYVREYTRGWRAWSDATRRGVYEVRAWSDGTTSSAFTDGYLDYNTDREKWHLAYCEAHHNRPGGCGIA